LSALLTSDAAHVRDGVLMLLYPLGPKAAPAVPNLVRLLQEANSGKQPVRDISQILWLLRKIGPDAGQAVPALTDLLLKPERDGNGSLSFRRTALLVALMQFGITPQALPALREMLQSSHPTEVACAAHAVAMLGPKAVDTIPLLLRPLRPDYVDESMTKEFSLGYSFDTSARVEVMRTLGHFGAAAKEALPQLHVYADSPDKIPNRPYRQRLLQQEAQQAIQAIQQTGGA
jgi:HEAT repeat protein